MDTPKNTDQTDELLRIDPSPNCSASFFHPLSKRLLDHAETQFVVYTEIADDLIIAAKHIEDQHDGISKALEAVLDGDLNSCIHLLMVVANEYPFTQNVQSPPTGGGKV